MAARLTREEFLASAPPEAVAALNAGRNVQHEGHYYTAEGLGMTHRNAVEIAADASRQSAALVRRNEELETALAETRALLVDAQAAPGTAELQTQLAETRAQLAEAAKKADPKAVADMKAAIARLQAYGDALPDDQKAAFQAALNPPAA